MSRTDTETPSPPSIPSPPSSYTAFDGHRQLASGTLADIAVAVRHAVDANAAGPVLIFDDATGRSIDIDTRGSDDDLRQRFAPHGQPAADAAPKGRGRPKLGVVPREVTLLPRHWDWLAAQHGGASVALRKLVDEARQKHAGRDLARRAQERTYHFMSAMAGDLPGFEEASRALFAADGETFGRLIAAWPADIREHLQRLQATEDLAAAL